MKVNIMKLLIIALILSFIGAGAAVAGGYKSFNRAPAHSGYHHGGGDYHHRPYYHSYHSDWQHGYRHYGPPVRYYRYHPYYYRGCDRYDGAYYFSGAFSEPGFGFVFGTRGGW